MPSSACTVFSDATSGSDQSGDGSLDKPYRTVARALKAVRGQPGSVIGLNGTFFLEEAVQLTSEHSGVIISSLHGHQARLSGGMPLTLKWSPSRAVAGAYIAELEDWVPNFTSLFVDGRREIHETPD